MVSQSVGQQIIVGVTIGVTVMVIVGFFKRELLAPPVAQTDDTWYGTTTDTVSGWFS